MPSGDQVKAKRAAGGHVHPIPTAVDGEDSSSGADSERESLLSGSSSGSGSGKGARSGTGGTGARDSALTRKLRYALGYVARGFRGFIGNRLLVIVSVHLFLVNLFNAIAMRPLALQVRTCARVRSSRGCVCSGRSFGLWRCVWVPRS